MKECPRCGQTRPDLGPGDEAMARVWDWLHTTPGHMQMTWVELKAAVEEFHKSQGYLNSLMAAALFARKEVKYGS